MLHRIFAYPAFLALLGLGCLASGEPFALGGNPHLFLDDFLLDRIEDATLTVNPPKREDLVLIADQPWESGGITSYGNAFWDPIAQEYRLYYVPVCWDVKPGYCTALAISKDGLHWEKPNLGAVEWKGSKENNIVLWAQREGTVLIDFTAEPEHRYAIVSSEPELRTRLFTSPDGIHFTMHEEKLSEHQSDSQISTFFDDSIEKFVHFFKVYEGDDWQAEAEVVTAPNIEFPQDQRLGRSVARVEVPSLDTPWPEPYTVVMARDSRDPDAMDLYTNAAIKYEWASRVYFAFPTPYYHYNEPAERAYLNQPTLAIGGKSNDGVIESQLATSRDGRIWTRYRSSYVPMHRYQDLDLKVVHVYPGMIRTPDDEIVQYYAGYTFTHGDTQVRYKNLGRKLGGVFRTVQRLDGFVSLDFDYEGGTVTTDPFTFEGNRLLLNVNTSASGQGRVAILDEAGEEIPGYGITEARIVSGDYLQKEAAWGDEGNTDVGPLAGKRVRLKFEFRGTKLYSFRFTD